MSDARPIGVFDSGVGGLSVLKAIRRELPGEDVLYVADSGYAPYGDRTTEFIEERAIAVVDFLRDEGVKAVVVACNTATGVSVETLRSRYDFPIVAMEPAVKTGCHDHTHQNRRSACDGPYPLQLEFSKTG